MKKLRTDTGGYALIYVLIVVLVLCAVAVSVCTAALKNYQAQEDSVRQTQQLYQAEGEIEKFVALAEDVSDVSSLTVSGTYGSESDAMDAAKTAYEDYLNYLYELVKPPPASGYTLTLDTDDTGDTANDSCKFTLTYKNDTVCIETKISMALTYDVNTISTQKTQPDGTIKTETTYTAKVSKAAHGYDAYTITHLTAEGGASG